MQNTSKTNEPNLFSIIFDSKNIAPNPTGFYLEEFNKYFVSHINTLMQVIYMDNKRDWAAALENLLTVFRNHESEVSEAINAVVEEMFEFIKHDDTEANQMFIHNLKKSFGRKNFGRRGIYKLEIIAEFFATGNEALLNLVEESKEDILKIVNEK